MSTLLWATKVCPQRDLVCSKRMRSLCTRRRTRSYLTMRSTRMLQGAPPPTAHLRHSKRAAVLPCRLHSTLPSGLSNPSRMGEKNPTTGRRRRTATFQVQGHRGSHCNDRLYANANVTANEKKSRRRRRRRLLWIKPDKLTGILWRQRRDSSLHRDTNTQSVN